MEGDLKVFWRIGIAIIESEMETLKVFQRIRTAIIKFERAYMEGAGGYGNGGLNLYVGTIRPQEANLNACFIRTHNCRIALT